MRTQSLKIPKERMIPPTRKPNRRLKLSLNRRMHLKRRT